ncbi:amidase domain-containing protein [Virgibacillus pantothenticus]|uniref:amidase domain-containing protein n=1 Tax=Virgibacillus pantothenticus TaxID=1473 RepID=UPI00098506D9|nr:amidase domain-containing protein [Virgibacillus pantothenticus]
MEQLKAYWQDFFSWDRKGDDWWTRKQALFAKRDAEIVKIKGNGHVYSTMRYDQQEYYQYHLHVQFLVKQEEQLYLEESVTPYIFRMDHLGEIKDHQHQVKKQEAEGEEQLFNETDKFVNTRSPYDRQAAVQYAERWWNDYNPAYRQFPVDCTNYVSQCLYAGGAPMYGAPVRERGWWYQDNNWSFSWAVAHSLRWYLAGATKGLRGEQKETAEQLIPGDVICYDFSGDGRWDHNTIVVAKDANGMPLVNAHTDNSRNRYWSYEDSAAWTPDIQYKFFRIYTE